MAFHIEITTSNGYRCSCCASTRSKSHWVDTPGEALVDFPQEFPREGEWSGEISRVIKDGTTGKVVAESTLTWPPNYQRGDAYKVTQWSAWVDEETFPGRGVDITQLIEGRNTIGFMDDPDEPRDPLVFISDKTLLDVCDELKEKKRLWDLRQAESQLAEAQKKIEALTGSGGGTAVVSPPRGNP